MSFKTGIDWIDVKIGGAIGGIKLLFLTPHMKEHLIDQGVDFCIAITIAIGSAIAHFIVRASLNDPESKLSRFSKKVIGWIK